LSRARRERQLRFTATASDGDVSAVSVEPEAATALLVLAHGAGAGMRHRTMEALALELADAGVATLRYQFPYMEQRRRAPGPPRSLLDTVRSAVRAAAELCPGLPLLAGGKSMGGRMTSMAAAREPLPGVRGIVFFGFPLHPAGRPSTERAAHLARVGVPLLFLQGTRDRLAEMALMREVCRPLRRAELHALEGADHAFHVLKRSGRTDGGVLVEMAACVARFAARLVG